MYSGRELGRRVKATFGVLGGFVVAAFVVWMLMGLMVRMAVARIPAQWETELGDSLVIELKEHEVFTNDVKLKAKLDLAVAPLLRALPRDGHGIQVLHHRGPAAQRVRPARRPRHRARQPDPDGGSPGGVGGGARA